MIGFSPERGWVALVEAARILQLTEFETYRLISIGAMRGRNRNGLWYVESESLWRIFHPEFGEFDGTNGVDPLINNQGVVINSLTINHLQLTVCRWCAKFHVGRTTAEVRTCLRSQRGSRPDRR
jgi:hypothetical protein